MRTRLLSLAAAAVTVLVLSPALALAQQSPPSPPATSAPEESPISAERPGFTNGVDTVPPGHLQFEIGYTYSGSGGSHLSQIGNGAQLRIPLNERTEVRLGFPSYQWAYNSEQRTQSGFTDTILSAKFRFLDGIQGHRPGLAVIAGTTLPDTGSKAFREGNAQPSAALESHYDFSSLWSAELDYVYTSASSDNQRFDQRSGGLCFTYNITPLVGTFLETYRINPTDIGGPTGDYMDGGFTYIVGNNTQYDISAGKGVTSGVRSDFFVGAGYARRF